ncbi:hypothetical protein QYF36_015344 [Acer negundo]|nr:hypothetical protein QYF36_015344 [Acer negundo]
MYSLLEEARKMFHRMLERMAVEALGIFELMCIYVPRIDHCAYMVDFLSRAGKLDEANEFIDSITVDHETVVPNNPRDAVLNLFKRISPDIFIHGIDEMYAGEIMNAIAREGTKRIERPDTYKQWQVQNPRDGFKRDHHKESEVLIEFGLIMIR